MHIQLGRIFTIVALLGFVFVSCSSKADDRFKNIPWASRELVSSFPVKDALVNMDPSAIISLCIATVILSVLFRGIIFFMIIFGVLILMFGSTEEAIDHLREKFNFEKNIRSQPMRKVDKD